MFDFRGRSSAAAAIRERRHRRRRAGRRQQGLPGVLHRRGMQLLRPWLSGLLLLRIRHEAELPPHTARVQGPLRPLQPQVLAGAGHPCGEDERYIVQLSSEKRGAR